MLTRYSRLTTKEFAGIVEQLLLDATYEGRIKEQEFLQEVINRLDPNYDIPVSTETQLNLFD